MSAASTAKAQRRGEVLAVVRELLLDGRVDEALLVVAKLVKRNGELERLLHDATTRAKKSEGVSSAQLQLILGGLVAEADGSLKDADEKLRAASGIDTQRVAEAKPERQPRVRKPLPEHLRRVENVIAVPAKDRPCPKCGDERACIGHDLTEVVDLIPAEVIVRLDMREKLGCQRCDGQLVRAPLGDKVVVGGKMGTALVAQLLVDKYRDGLPLNRQKQRFERMGLDVAISTLADQVTWATDLLRPLWRASMAEVLSAKVMHLDGTSLAVLDADKPGGIKLGSLWGYVGDDGGALTALYLYASTGKKEGQKEGELGPQDVLAMRQGYTVADASSLFDESFKRNELVECGCNMHSRRYFTKALDAGDLRAALPVAAFKQLYGIEEELRGGDPEERHRERQARSRPVYDELLAWGLLRKPHEPPSSALGRAIGYLLNHQVALRRFLDDGVIPIDNGVVERLHVRTALTRKNFLFAGSDAGAERAAIAYTLLGSCQLVDANPVAYLSDVLPRLARRVRLADVHQLLPARWKTAQT